MNVSVLKSKKLRALIPEKFRTYYFRANPFTVFLINGFCLGVVWVIFYSIFRYVDFVDVFYENAVDWLTAILLEISADFLRFLGFETWVYNNIIFITDTCGVMLQRGCLGRNLMGVFAGFVMAFPGNVKSKMWYIPFGLSVFMTLNMMRIIGLALVAYYFPDSHFDHHLVFNIMVYSAIFFLWTVWIRKFGRLKPLRLKNEE